MPELVARRDLSGSKGQRLRSEFRAAAEIAEDVLPAPGRTSHLAAGSPGGRRGPGASEARQSGARQSDEGRGRGRPPRLLIVADFPAWISEQLELAFPEPAQRVQVASAGHAAIDRLQSEHPDVILLSTERAGWSGLETYRAIRRIDPQVPVIFINSTSRADAAIEAMKHGAFDCLYEPLDVQQLRRAVDEALEVARRRREPAVAPEPDVGQSAEGTIVGNCPGMREVYKAIGRVAGQELPVLITGESGTGKDLVARALHQHGSRSAAPFLALNCAAIPEHLLESELFGHEKGAFTGADRRRIGKFEQCDGGTIFLDEIGDMPLPLQAKILRLMQEQTFERVGGNETVRTDVRLIAATHRDLKSWSELGKFRADLYYRLGVFSIHLPPLRERGDDLAALVRHYVRRFSRDLGREIRDVAPESLERLRAYDWPGNVRELQSVLKRALLRASGTVLLPAFLPELSGGTGEVAVAAAPAGRGFDWLALIRGRLGPDCRDLYVDVHRELDRRLLSHVMDYAQGNQHQAARLLGIARQTLRLKLRDLGLHVTHSVETNDEGEC